MSRPEPTPERLEAILSGREAAATDAERDLLRVAAALRDGTPRAGPELRARVRALGRDAPARRLERLRAAGWRGRLAIAVPALAAVAAAVITVGLLAGHGGSKTPVASSDAVGTETLAPSLESGPAPVAAGARNTSAVTVTVTVTDVATAAREVRDIVAFAGGAAEPQVRTPARAGATIIAATLPRDRAADALGRIGALGLSETGRSPSLPAGNGPVAVQVVLVPAP